MSGTSLDGLDLAYCKLRKEGGEWTFEMPHSTTYPYSPAWQARLEVLPNSTARHIAQINHEYGSLIGQKVRAFVKEHQLEVDFVASHGHTVFHDPAQQVTFQIGCGNAIAATCGLPVVYDFRSLDVALGGEGAPLAPVGDALLFSEYDLCLNLGGIANVSLTDKEGRRIAGDISACNQVLNYLANRLGQRYDRGGDIARSGDRNEDLLKQLNTLPFFTRSFPRSLGREWVEDEVLPLLVHSSLTIPDQMCTFVHHLADQIIAVLDKTGVEAGKMLITGGGAFNTYLIEQLRKRTEVELVIPNKELIEFREALIFALLGVLRWRQEINVWSSVTGSNSDHSSGVIVIPPGKD